MKSKSRNCLCILNFSFLYAYVAADGTFLWSKRTNGKIDGFLSISADDKYVYVPDGDGYVNAIETDNVKKFKKLVRCPRININS